MKMRLYSTGGERALQLTGALVIALALMGFLGVGQVAKAQIGFSLGDAATFVVLDEGYGNNQLSFNNGTIDGNIGIGDPSGTQTTKLAASGGGTYLNGNVEFAGAVDDAGSNGLILGTGDTITGNNTNVQTDLNYLNNLSTTLGAEQSGTGIVINLQNNGTQTILASSGKLDSNGNYVITVNASNFHFNNGATLTINGQGLGHNVVLDFTTQGNLNFGGMINLTGGLTSSQVLFNISGTNQTLQFSENKETVSGTFLDPNGAITGSSVTIDGHIYGGGNNNMQIVSGTNVISTNQ